MTTPEPSTLSEQIRDALIAIAGDGPITAPEQAALEEGCCLRCRHASHRGSVCGERYTDAAGSMDTCGCRWRSSPIQRHLAVDEVVVAVTPLIAQARAARPSPTCATCKHYAQTADPAVKVCINESEIDGGPNDWYVPPTFSCNQHEPSPPAQDGGRP